MITFSGLAVLVDFAFLVYVLFGFSAVTDTVSAGAGTGAAFLLVLLLDVLPFLAGAFFSLPAAFLSVFGASAATTFSALGFLPALLFGFSVSGAVVFTTVFDFGAAAVSVDFVAEDLSFRPALLLGFSAVSFLGCSAFTSTGAAISAAVSILLFSLFKMSLVVSVFFYLSALKKPPLSYFNSV